MISATEDLAQQAHAQAGKPPAVTVYPDVELLPDRRQQSGKPSQLALNFRKTIAEKLLNLACLSRVADRQHREAPVVYEKFFRR